MTFVLVLRASSLSMEGYCCIASSGSSGTACGLLRRCILTAADHINDLIVAYESLRLACMVFIRLFEFFTVSFKLRRRIIRIIRPCVRSSGSTSSLRPAPPRRCLISTSFVYSSNRGLHRHLLPRRSSAPATAVEAFSAGPSNNSVWLCTLPCTSGIGNTGACHRPRCVPGPGKPGNVSPDG